MYQKFVFLILELYLSFFLRFTFLSTAASLTQLISLNNTHHLSKDVSYCCLFGLFFVCARKSHIYILTFNSQKVFGFFLAEDTSVSSKGLSQIIDFGLKYILFFLRPCYMILALRYLPKRFLKSKR